MYCPSTAVDIAVARGATVLPYRWRDDSAAVFARSQGALLASRRSPEGYSLAPASLRTIPPGSALVLPSPNGSTLCAITKAAVVFTACLRNCGAVAAQAVRAYLEDGRRRKRRWRPPCSSDSGKVCTMPSRGAFPGANLLERGYPDDVELAAELGVSGAAPWLREGRFVNAAG